GFAESVANRKGADMQPAHATVGTNDAVVELRAESGHAALDERLGGVVAIVRVDCLDPRLRLRVEAGAGASGDFLVGRAHVVDLRTVRVGQEEYRVNVVRDLAEAHFTFGERFRGALARCNLDLE